MFEPRRFTSHNTSLSYPQDNLESVQGPQGNGPGRAFSTTAEQSVVPYPQPLWITRKDPSGPNNARLAARVHSQKAWVIVMVNSQRGVNTKAATTRKSPGPLPLCEDCNWGRVADLCLVTGAGKPQWFCKNPYSCVRRQDDLAEFLARESLTTS